jgi:inner membrane protease ATP23
MVDALRAAGCPVDRRFFSVETCEQQVVGGFRTGGGVRQACDASQGASDGPSLLTQVVMCHNRLQSATEFENMLVHELVHAFDHCRARNLDWSNCEHHACSEARRPRRTRPRGGGGGATRATRLSRRRRCGRRA